MEKGYKVVQVIDGMRRPYIIWGESKLFYIPGEETVPRPNEGPLCVFGEDRMLTAARFMQGYHYGVWHTKKAELWSCDFERSSGLCIYVDDGVNEFPLSALPSGTVLADKVILRERLMTL